MTLDNTARVDQGSRVGKVWRSPASSKPVYVCEVEVTGPGSTEVPLEGDFKVVDIWLHKDASGSAAGDTIEVLSGSNDIAPMLDHDGFGPVIANAVVRTGSLQNVAVGLPGATLTVQAAGAATVAGSVYIAVQLNS